MLRRFIFFFIAFCVGWQSLAYGGSGVMLTSDAEQAHQLLHFQGVAHHHHAQDDHHALDDDPHQDESVASIQHVVIDSGIFSPALIVGSLTVPTSPMRYDPPAASVKAWPSASLDGLERPPRLTA